MMHDLLKLAMQGETLKRVGGCGYTAADYFAESSSALRAAHAEIQQLRAELQDAKALIERHEAALEWAFVKSQGGLPIILRRIERDVKGIEFFVDKYTIYGIMNISGFHKTPLAAIEAAMKEEHND